MGKKKRNTPKDSIEPQKNYYFPLYWLFNRDLGNGILIPV